jgi:hypothetical protein
MRVTSQTTVAAPIDTVWDALSTTPGSAGGLRGRR